MMKTLYIGMIMAATVCPATTVSAQEKLSGSLSAVGDYKAEIRAHSRLSGLPQRLRTRVPSGSLPIAVEALPVQVPPVAGIQTTGTAGRSLPKSYRGYAALTAGSYLDVSLSAGYRFIENEHTTFGAWLQHSSTSLFRPETASPDVEADRRKIYDETIGLYGSHLFDGAGTLKASAAYRFSRFNYYSTALTAQGDALNAPWQTLNDFRLNALWQGERSRDAFYIDGEMSYRYFGYHRFLPPYTSENKGVSPTRENDLRAGVTAGYDFGETGVVSLAAETQTLIYQHPHAAADMAASISDPFSVRLMPLRSSGVVRLTPRYTLTRGNWGLRVGAKVDLSWGVTSPEDFGTFHIAPDVEASYTGGKATVYLSADGGVTPTTLASLSELDMYTSPALLNTLPQYSPINATIGLRLGSFEGFSAGVHASYVIADNTPLSGWYPYWLAGEKIAGERAVTVPSSISLKGFSLGAEAEYQLGTIMDVKGAMTYQRQSGKTGVFNGLDRPRWTIGLTADVYPINGLCIGASYEYRGVRNITLARYSDYDQHPEPSHNFTDSDKDYYIIRRLPDIYDLGVHARYTLRDRYTFSVAADNLLGCNPSLHRLMPEPGVSITGGFSVLF